MFQIKEEEEEQREGVACFDWLKRGNPEVELMRNRKPKSNKKKNLPFSESVSLSLPKEI